MTAKSTMMQISEGSEDARASPVGDAEAHHLKPTTNELKLPSFTERTRLKKLALRELFVASLNVGTMTGRSQHVMEMMKKRQIEALSVQETR